MTNVKRPGAIALIAIIFISAFALVVMISASRIASQGLNSVSVAKNGEQALNAAESGLQDALYRIGSNNAPATYTVTNLNGLGTDVTINISVVTPFQRLVKASAYTAASNVTRTVQIQVATSAFGVTLSHAVQSGEGGFVMGNSDVFGDVTSNGSFDGVGNNSRISGNLQIANGAAEATSVSTGDLPSDKDFGDAAARVDAAQSFQVGADSVMQRAQVRLKRGGGTLPNNITVSLVRDNAGKPSILPYDVIATGSIAKNSVGASYAWIDISFATNSIGVPLYAGDTYWLVLDMPSPDSKHPIWNIDGSSNPIPSGQGMLGDFASNTWATAGGDMALKTWVNIGTTNAQDVRVLPYAITASAGDLHAHSITNCTIAGTAAYAGTNFTSSTAAAQQPNSAEVAHQDFPIKKADIDQLAGTISSGPHIAAHNVNGAETMSSTTIDGDLTIDSNGDALTVNGNLYIKGNLDMSHPGVTLRAANSVGANSIFIIVEGTISVDQNANITSNGTTGNFIVLISKSYARQIPPGGTPAIQAQNNSSAAVYYALNGTIFMKNGAALKNASGFFVNMENGSSVTYDAALGLINGVPSSPTPPVPDPTSWQEL